MENRKLKSSGVSGALPPRGIPGPGPTSAPPPRSISGALQPRGVFGVQTSSAPPPHGTSGSERHPRPMPPLTAKPHRRTFVVPAPRHAEGAPVPGQDTLSPGGVLPRRLPDEVGAPSTMVPRRLALAPSLPAVAVTKVLPLHGTHPSSFTDLLLSSGYNAKTSPLDHDAAWDTLINALSTLPLGYEAAEDDRSPTRMSVFDWTPSRIPSMAGNASQVIMCAEM
jgi:hypothetical protein